MTEEEWLASTDPDKLRRFLPPTPSERKLRLWACACCRRIWHLVTDPRCHRSVEVAELEADGSASQGDLELARLGAGAAANEAVNQWQQRMETADRNLVERDDLPLGQSEASAAEMAFYLASLLAHSSGRLMHGDPYAIAAEVRAAVQFSADPQPFAFVPQETPVRKRARREEEAAQAALLRDIFGNPFRPVSLEPAWLTSTVTALATGIYAERAFDRMPILADALEEAGCDNLDILNHCRGPGAHVLGCWVVDLLLGKG